MEIGGRFTSGTRYDPVDDDGFVFMLVVLSWGLYWEGVGRSAAELRLRAPFRSLRWVPFSCFAMTSITRPVALHCIAGVFPLARSLDHRVHKNVLLFEEGCRNEDESKIGYVYEMISVLLAVTRTSRSSPPCPPPTLSSSWQSAISIPHLPPLTCLRRKGRLCHTC